MRYGYVRVSSVDQNTERQLSDAVMDKVFVDKVSGKDMNRPALIGVLAALKPGDTLVVHSMDRLARNAEDLLRTVRELNGRGVTIEFVKNHMTFSGESDPMAHLMLTLLGAFAEFERSLIRERQREGVAIAKAAGKYKGGHKKLTAKRLEQIKDKLASGVSKTRIAKEYGITRQTLYNNL